MTSQPSSSQAIRIETVRQWEPLRLREVWEYRELLYFLVRRDMKTSYARTDLGIGWAVLRPLLTMAVFTVIFGWLTQLPSDGVPYPMFVYSALLPWQLFARTVTGAGSSMVMNENLLTKVYFPRLIAPLSITAAGILDFAIGFCLLAGMMWYYRIAIATAVLILPVLVIVTVATGLGVGLWFAALNVFSKDIGHAQPFLTQIWLFATPVIYPISLVPDGWRTWYALNPMTGVVEGFRRALLRSEGGVDAMLGVSAIVAGVVLVSGLYFFKRTEQIMADSV